MASEIEARQWDFRNRKFGVVAFGIAIFEPILICGPVFAYQKEQMPAFLFSTIGWIYFVGLLLSFVIAILGLILDEVRIWAWSALFLTLLDVGLCVFPFAI
jgi:hypothetical protein